MLKLLALLDPPSEHSFGMVPFVVSGDDLDAPTVVGLANGNQPLKLGWGMYTLEEFIAAGHARDVSSLDITFPDMPSGLVAGWVGHGFLQECRRLGLPDPKMPVDRLTTPKGMLWIDPPAFCRLRQRRWLLAVAPRAFKERSHEITKLMSWCDPCHEVTCAADWYTDDSPGRERALRFALIGLDHDRKGWLAERTMRKRLQKIVDRYLKTA